MIHAPPTYYNNHILKHYLSANQSRLVHFFLHETCNISLLSMGRKLNTCINSNILRWISPKLLYDPWNQYTSSQGVSANITDSATLFLTEPFIKKIIYLSHKEVKAQLSTVEKSLNTPVIYSAITGT